MFTRYIQFNNTMHIFFYFRRPEKYARQTEYTGAPVMMDKHSLYNQSFAPGPYDNFSMRSYSPGASYRGVATMPELGYDNTGYGGTARGKVDGFVMSSNI